MAPLQAILILGQMENTSVQVSYLCSTGGCHIWPRAPALTSIMGRTVAAFLPSSEFIRVKLEQWPLLRPFQSWSDGTYFCSGAHLWSPGECNIWLRAPRLDFNNCP